MLLTLGDKLRIYFGNFSFLLGLVFVTVGLGVLGFNLPAFDFESVWFLAQPTAQAPGTITSASPTNYGEEAEKDRVWQINYTFSLAGQQREGHSYSSTQIVSPGTAVQVEYVRARPALSRISGTLTAPMPLWALLPLVGSLVSGLVLIYNSASYCGRAIAIADEAFVTPAICKDLKAKTPKSDDHEHELEYIARYVYHFNGREYQHLCDVSTTELKQFSKQEYLALQRSAPANAMLVANLPRLVRRRLQTPPCTFQ